MKVKRSSLGWFTLLLPVLCVGVVHAAPSLSPDDEVRNVTGFHALSNSGSIDVEVHFGNRESVRLEGSEAAIGEIETVVENGILKIRNKKRSGFSDRDLGKVTAYVTTKRIDALTQSGSGKMTVIGVISGTELNASLSGSGRIIFASDIDVCNVSISGSGRIVANGAASESNISISGSGQFDGRELRSQSANLKISGSGNISLHVDKQLDAAISGSGNVSYSGNAKTNVRTSGSGRIRKI